MAEVPEFVEEWLADFRSLGQMDSPTLLCRIGLHNWSCRISNIEKRGKVTVTMQADLCGHCGKYSSRPRW